MSKRQLIAEIRQLNASADETFLGQFSEEDLRTYLERLRAARAHHVHLYSRSKTQHRLAS